MFGQRRAGAEVLGEAPAARPGRLEARSDRAARGELTRVVMTAGPPRAFISYSHDNDAHRDRVLELANRLRSDGIDARLDRYVVNPEEGWARWTQREFEQADFVIAVCTATYKRRFEGRERAGTGRGATWEGLLATQLLYEGDSLNRKLVPVLVGDAGEKDIPLSLRPFAYFRVPADYTELLRVLAGEPEVSAPPIGDAESNQAGAARAPLMEPRVLSDGLPSPEHDPAALHALEVEMAKLASAIEGLQVVREHVPFSREWLFDALQRTVGRRAALPIFAAILVSLVGIAKWETIVTLPGVGRVVRWVSEAPVPQASSERFSVLVAHLDHDRDGTSENFIVDALTGLQDIEVLRLDRMISTAGPKPQEAIEAGHARAREFLRRSGASVLVWGTVLDGTSATRLYWTPSHPGIETPTGRYPRAQLELSGLLGQGVADVLRLLVVTQSADLTARRGQFVPDLAPFVAKVRSILAGRMAQDWSPDTRSEILVVLADALSNLGEQKGDARPLEEAITSYREALTVYSRAQFPVKWAATQNNLGVALATLGAWESGTWRLEEAALVYREALKERTREKSPVDWAMTQVNLGDTLSALGERDSGTKRLEEAVGVYREVLAVYTETAYPLDWAMAQVDLGNALAALGNRDAGSERLEEAIAAYRNALKVYAPDRAPLDWATTQNDLGNALTKLGKRERATERLDEAVAAYREALAEYTRERFPLKWGIIQNNLGEALEELGGTQRLQEAVAAYRESLNVLTQQGDSYYSVGVTANLERARQRLE